MLCISRNALQSTRRSFVTSNITCLRFRGSSSPPSELVKVGRICETKKEGLYQPGQLFLHRVFAYRGIIICSFNVKVYGQPKKNEAIGTTESVPCYQVLVNRGDWNYMNFRSDHTCYLTQMGANREEKVLNTINGMDCVPHNEIIPFSSNEQKPLEHDLFERLFEHSEETNDVNYKFRRSLEPHFFMNNKESWMAPQGVYKDVVENIEVTVVPFYLGPTFVSGQRKHYWRYVIRLESLDKKTVTLRERHLKVFTLNMNLQVTGHGINGGNPRLTAENPVVQFSSTVDLFQPKGGRMWGRFIMERENGTTFDINVPTVVLESPSESVNEQNENVIH